MLHKRVVLIQTGYLRTKKRLSKNSLCRKLSLCFLFQLVFHYNHIPVFKRWKCDGNLISTLGKRQVVS